MRQKENLYPSVFMLTTYLHQYNRLLMTPVSLPTRTGLAPILALTSLEPVLNYTWVTTKKAKEYPLDTYTEFYKTVTQLQQTSTEIANNTLFDITKKSILNTTIKKIIASKPDYIQELDYVTKKGIYPVFRLLSSKVQSQYL